MNTTRKKKQLPCVCAAGVGERDTENLPCRCHDITKGRNAVRAIWDTNGRWIVHWRERDGEEWVGTYRLIPC